MFSALTGYCRQNVFSNKLVAGIIESAPEVDSSIILKMGATALAQAIPPNLLDGVQLAYNNALVETWYVATAMACFTIIGAVGIEWKSVKGKKIETIAA